MAKQKKQPVNVGGRWAVVIVVLLLLGLISYISAFIIGIFVAVDDIDIDEPGNVAHITLAGPIMSYSPGGFMSEQVADSTTMIELIEDASENEGVVAILLEINSPGGTAVASHEIVQAIKASNKTVVAWIREVGASGGYWVASAADHIVVDPMTITGSIGVIGSYIEWEGTLERYNASYRRLVSGDYKDMGSPFKTMTEDEENVMQEALDTMREYFVSDVAANRGLSKEAVDAVADGRFYLGIKAKELGLVDELGGMEEAVSYIEKKHGIEADLAEYREDISFADFLAGLWGDQSFMIGQGIGKSFLDADVNKKVSIRT